jgi:DNA mismatch repair ATPase MutL
VKDAIFESLQNNERKRYENTRQKLSSLPLLTPLSPTEEIIVRDLYNTKSQLHKTTYPTQNADTNINTIDHVNNEKIKYDDLMTNINTSIKKNDLNMIDFKERVASDKESATINHLSIEDHLALPTPNNKEGFIANKEIETKSSILTSSQHMLLKTMREDFAQMWQLHNTYIFIQIDNGFVVFDQHAAHERILYEKLLRNIDQKKPNKQKLVFPLIIDLPSYMSENIKYIIDNNNEILNNLGFTIKVYSGNSIVIDEIPSELGYWDGGNIFVEILKQLEDEIQQTKDFRIASAAAVACKASIKAGQKMSKREMHELITELFKCDFPYQCPHGRPLVIKMSLTDIEKMFKRII